MPRIKGALPDGQKSNFAQKGALQVRTVAGRGIKLLWKSHTEIDSDDFGGFIGHDV